MIYLQLIQIINMSDSAQDKLWKVLKLVGVAALSVALNHLLKKGLAGNQTDPLLRPISPKRRPSMRVLPSVAKLEDQQEVREQRPELWGSLKLVKVGEEDGLLQELEMMTRLMCPFQKVNNLIVDLQLHDVKTYPCTLLAHSVKHHRDEPFLMPASLVKPGEFVIQNCMFRAGQSIETEKKFIRAGPRSTQYFDPSTVRADIVCLGKTTPGINNVIRQLVALLKDNYKVERVTGVRFSWMGYYNNDMIDLTPELVGTIHHRGGCWLGLAASPFKAGVIVDSLERRGVNQLYLIGGNDTIKSSTEIYSEIKKRELNIALCVNLKAINKDIPYFDNCFGFQSAVEQSQRFIEQGYALSKSNYNSVVLVKVPGRFSGFLAMDAVRAARNANVCLVPEFAMDLYGDRGLLQYVANRIRAKGYCILVYSQGASYAIRDIPEQKHCELLLRKETSEQYAFDLFLRQELKRTFEEKNLIPHNVFFFDSQNAVRTVPANSFDTKLCSQIALCSIQGLMCGYTNFVIGHFKSRVAMVPLREMVNAERFSLRIEDENWQRLLATTGQPSFRNDHHGNHY